MAAFIFSAKWGFFTWSQLNQVSLEQFHTAFTEVFNKHGCPYKYVLGRERHQDGNVHIHALVEYDIKRKLRGLDKFTVLTRSPNSRPVTSAQYGANYCSKDGEIVTNDEAWFESCKSNTHGPRIRKRKFNDIIQEATSKQDVLNTFKTHCPRDYYLYYDKLNSNLDSIFKPPETQYVPTFELSEFSNPHPDIVNWYADNVIGPHPKVSCAYLHCVRRLRETP